MYDRAWLPVLPPELLPSSIESLSKCVGSDYSLVTDLVEPLLRLPDASPKRMEIVVRRTYERVRNRCGDRMQLVADPAETRMNHENDKALYIFRTSGPLAPILLHGAVQAYMEFLGEIVETGTDLEANEVGEIDRQFRIIFALLADSRPHSELESETSLQTAKLDAERLDPLRRWVRGHHVFTVMLQWQVIVFQCLRSHVESYGGSRESAELLRLLILSMRAAAQAFRFTGEFDSEDYIQHVRPTLMPPLAPEGMSGANWRDHQYLMRRFKKLGPLLDQADEECRELYAEFKRELRHVYDAHKHVCAQFVGSEDVSLQSIGSAVSVLDKLKHLRSRLL